MNEVNELPAIIEPVEPKFEQEELRQQLVRQIEPYTRWACTQSTDDLFAALEHKAGFIVHNPDDANYDRFAIRWGSLPILGVCHADTVLGEPQHYSYNRKTKTVISAELDDRLGLASHLLMASQWDYTILVCDHEEVGNTTAADAVDTLSLSDWNWIFELDRRGIDVVSYDYSDDTWDGLLGHYFKEVGWGSFSDIGELEALKAKAFNLGIGYHQEHSRKCHADLRDTVDQLMRLDRMLRELNHVPFKHKPRLGSSWRGGGYRTYKPASGSPVFDDWDDPDQGIYGSQGWYDSGTGKTHYPATNGSVKTETKAMVLAPVPDDSEGYQPRSVAKSAAESAAVFIAAEREVERQLERQAVGESDTDEILIQQPSIFTEGRELREQAENILPPSSMIDCACCESLVDPDVCVQFGYDKICKPCWSKVVLLNS